MKKYDVKIACITDLTAMVTVEAETPEAAAALAITKGEDAEWEFPDSKGPVPMAGTEEAFLVYDGDTMEEELELPQTSAVEYVTARANAAFLREAVDAFPQFDGDEHVSGADLVDWFDEWRRRVKAALGLPAVPAECHSDDRAVEAQFDAAPWLSLASEDAIRALARCDWGGDYAADVVAEFMRGTAPDVARMFTHIENLHGKRDAPGFECHVDQAAALRWLETYRPDLHAELTATN